MSANPQRIILTRIANWLPSNNDGPLFSRKQIIVLFCAAVAIRLAYVGIVAVLGGEFNNGSDSGKFIKRALSLLKHGEIIYLDYGVLIPDTARMPGYPYFLAGIFELFGDGRLWLVGVIQAFIDASTVLAIGLIAGAINRSWALPAATLACAWATLVVYSSFVLSDTLFLAFFCWGICACVWATRSKHRVLLMVSAGIGFSLALQTRTTLMFFPYLLAPLLGYLLWSVNGVRWYRSIALAAIPSVMIVLSITPQIAKNNANYGKPVLTTQSGNHAMDVVDQFLRVCPQCITDGMEGRMYIDLQARLANQSVANQRNPIILNQLRRDVALDYLKQVPLSAVLHGTITGVLRSTVQTALYETAHQMHWSPKFFSATTGTTMTDRLIKFTKSVFTDGFLLVWALAQSAAIIALALQFTGALNGICNRAARPYVIFLIAVGAYFLIINGPFGNARYGMPLTPIVVVLTAAGLMAVLDRFRRQGLVKTREPAKTAEG